MIAINFPFRINRNKNTHHDHNDVGDDGIRDDDDV